jgi:toxin HigB-1
MQSHHQCGTHSLGGSQSVDRSSSRKPAGHVVHRNSTKRSTGRRCRTGTALPHGEDHAARLGRWPRYNNNLQPVSQRVNSLSRTLTCRPANTLRCITYRYTIYLVIQSFRDRDTQALFSGRCPRRWLAIRPAAERKLAQLDAAATLEFLRAPPGNRLESLKGNRAGQWSIRINDRWRVCFRWNSGDALDVEIVDYH